MWNLRTIYRITKEVDQDSKEVHIVMRGGRRRIEGMMVVGML